MPLNIWLTAKLPRHNMCMIPRAFCQINGLKSIIPSYSHEICSKGIFQQIFSKRIRLDFNVSMRIMTWHPFWNYATTFFNSRVAQFSQLTILFPIIRYACMDGTQIRLKPLFRLTKCVYHVCSKKSNAHFNYLADA